MENQNTKKCKHCQTDIPAGAKKCPQCQGDLRNWPTRHPILTILGLIIIVPFIVFFVSPIIPNSSSPSQISPPANQNTEKSTGQSSPAAQQDLLELLSFNCYTEYDYFHIVGEVKNISDKSLESVVAVGSAYTQDGEFVKSDEALIDYNPILSGQTSPFEVLMTGNPAIKKCKVGFKEFWGGMIPTKRE